MESKNREIDKIDELDLKILSILMKDAKVPYTRIGESLFVSPGTVHVRMRKMEQLGIIKRHELVVNYEKLGYDVTAFLGIYLQKSSLYNEVANDLEQIPEVTGLHYTTGIYSMFVKIVCKDTKHLRHVLHDKIQSIDGIQRTETFISLHESINRPLRLLREDVKA